MWERNSPDVPNLAAVNDSNNILRRLDQLSEQLARTEQRLGERIDRTNERLGRMEAMNIARYEHYTLIIFLDRRMLKFEINISSTRNASARIQNAASLATIDTPLVPLRSTTNQVINDFPRTIVDLERLSSKDVVLLI
jgi:hypothetical protein